ncbi:MAG: hypothetical protein ACKVWV_18385 [Planctomycetota bacterium]
MKHRHLVGLPASAILVLALACRQTAERPAAPAAPAQSHASVADASAELPLPTLEMTKPADFAGIHNVVAYAPHVFSGSMPEGEEGLETLSKLGVRTIISVDGAPPDVAGAKKLGMRYVHYPIGYNGVSPERSLEISRAVKELPGPVYIHCHHGKHRSAGAAGVAVVTLGLGTEEAMLERMKVSGTAAGYKGLFQCVKDADPANAAKLAALSGPFPEVTATPGFVQAMVQVDEVNDHLKAVEKAGWTVPADHPDLVPVAEAGRLADLFRDSAKDKIAMSKDARFVELLAQASQEVGDLEAALGRAGATAEEKSALFKKIQATCKACHVDYRD